MPLLKYIFCGEKKYHIKNIIPAKPILTAKKHTDSLNKCRLSLHLKAMSKIITIAGIRLIEIIISLICGMRIIIEYSPLKAEEIRNCTLLNDVLVIKAVKSKSA